MRRFFPIVCFLAILPLAGAQELPADRAQVLQRVSDTLANRAYVPGLDLKRWEAIVQEGKPRLAAAKTDDDFVREMNLDLRKLGVSHFSLLTPKQNTQRTTMRTIGIGVTLRPVGGRATGGRPPAERTAGEKPSGEKAPARPSNAGIDILSVAPGSPAEKAGFKAGAGCVTDEASA